MEARASWLLARGLAADLAGALLVRAAMGIRPLARRGALLALAVASARLAALARAERRAARAAPRRPPGPGRVK